jgi:hypothetical protein
VQHYKCLIGTLQRLHTTNLATKILSHFDSMGHHRFQFNLPSPVPIALQYIRPSLILNRIEEYLAWAPGSRVLD